MGSGMQVSTPGPDIEVSQTRPSNTTAYTAGDVIGAADSGTPANAGSAIWTFPGCPQQGVIEGASLRIDVASIPSGMTTMRLHLYKASPTAILDNAAWDLPSGDRSAYLGYIDLAPADMGSTLWAQSDSVNKRIRADTGGNLYGLLQTIGGFTPTSGAVKTITLRVVAL